MRVEYIVVRKRALTTHSTTLYSKQKGMNSIGATINLISDKDVHPTINNLQLK